MECISYALAYFSAHDGEGINVLSKLFLNVKFPQAIFLKHDGFLGAVACVLDPLKEEIDITHDEGDDKKN